jgi:2-polyprenyl-3-methyl-5-hydroxy-6-metoxy-1,4-benzoquinol methylase
VLVGTDHREGLGGSFSVFCCRICGHGITDPIPADLSAWYPSDYAPHTHAGGLIQRAGTAAIRRTARDAYGSAFIAHAVSASALGGPLAPGASVLDIGAGSGAAVGALRDAGFDAHGVEPGARAVAAAHEAGITTLMHGTLETVALAPGAWDVVRLHHVLEHIPDPVTTLARIAELLSPTGRVVITVPNFGGLGERLFGASWDGLELPRHLHHFTRSSLEHAVGALGLRVTAAWTACVVGVYAGSLDALAHHGRRQAGWSGSMPLNAILFPLEFTAALAGAGDALVLVACRDEPRAP